MSVFWVGRSVPILYGPKNIVTRGSQAPHQHPGAQTDRDDFSILYPLLEGHSIKVKLDNTTAVAYIKHEGSTTYVALKGESQIISRM